jgi:transcriptional regulator with XRE-family HTH domain
MKRIGERIKQKRELLGLQLNDLAKRVGISPSALSQIEKAKSYPTIITLKLIAENLRTTVGDLIGENESLSNNPLYRREEIELIQHNNTGTELFILTQPDVSKQMDTLLMRFIKDSDSQNLLYKYNGQMFGYLLAGELQFEIDNKSYVVQKGDTVYFNTRRNYRFQNISNGGSEMVIVTLSAMKS